ncbi:hypothetical protein F5883DRAFT_537123 [Diaporthe sp. PMI_573]|nr:hypothetical protein F5883DRAFT_537123 [Diaporthaceae sp. PMI_573]
MLMRALVQLPVWIDSLHTTRCFPLSLVLCPPFSVSLSLPLAAFRGVCGLRWRFTSPRVGMWVTGPNTVPASSHLCATQYKDELGERRAFTRRQLCFHDRTTRLQT